MGCSRPQVEIQMCSFFLNSSQRDNFRIAEDIDLKQVGTGTIIDDMAFLNALFKMNAFFQKFIVEGVSECSKHGNAIMP
jgi:hypothetical protein